MDRGVGLDVKHPCPTPHLDVTLTSSLLLQLVLLAEVIALNSLPLALRLVSETTIGPSVSDQKTSFRWEVAHPGRQPTPSNFSFIRAPVRPTSGSFRYLAPRCVDRDGDRMSTNTAGGRFSSHVISDEPCALA